MDASNPTAPRSRILAAGTGIVVFLALVKLALHFASTGRYGYGFFVDEFRRPAPIRVAAEPDPVLHAAYDTTPGRAPA